jgi:hypothetical protein
MASRIGWKNGVQSVGVKNNCGLVVPVEEPGGEVDRRKMLIQVWRCSRQAG